LTVPAFAGAGLPAVDSGIGLSLSEKAGTRVLVLDTSALVMGLNPSGLSLPIYSVPSVMNELIPHTMPHSRFVASRDSGRLVVRKPSPSSVKAVEEASSRVGDVGVLSTADLDVLALALDLRESGSLPLIVTDDYAIQNVSETLAIEHGSLATFGISKKFEWIYHCPACFRKYTVEDADQVCRVCGTRLKRKVVKAEKAARKAGSS
jgi:rRNA maturation endonuclease Nob1